MIPNISTYKNLSPLYCNVKYSKVCLGVSTAKWSHQWFVSNKQPGHSQTGQLQISPLTSYLLQLLTCHRRRWTEQCRAVQVLSWSNMTRCCNWSCHCVRIHLRNFQIIFFSDNFPVIIFPNLISRDVTSPSVTKCHRILCHPICTVMRG